MEDIHRDHINNKGWNGVGYHFRVRLDGTIEKGRPVEMAGAHSKNMNFHSIGIVFEGNYSDYDKVPITKKMPEIQFLKGFELIKTLKEQYNISIQNINSHSFYNKTDCPGKYFPLVDLLSELTKLEEHWGVKGIQWMKEVGIITGEHEPTDIVTWAELGVVIKNLYMLKGE